MYNEFSKLFGKYYDNWVKKNQKKSKEEVLANMKETGIPLVVSIKQGEDWIDIETIDLIGDVNYNSLVIPIDQKLLTNELIEFRIRSGFMFWQLDYMAMDFSAPADISIQYLSPSMALGNGVIDYKASLNNDDDNYMEHLVTGDSTEIKFESLKYSASQSRTIILHSKGYYLPQKEYEGKPDKEELATFKEEAGLSRYSKKLYVNYFESLVVNPE